MPSVCGVICDGAQSKRLNAHAKAPKLGSGVASPRRSEGSTLGTLPRRSPRTTPSPDKKQPVPGSPPKRAAGLVAKERSVSKLGAEFPRFVHFAIRALMLDCRRALTRP